MKDGHGRGPQRPPLCWPRWREPGTAEAEAGRASGPLHPRVQQKAVDAAGLSRSAMPLRHTGHQPQIVARVHRDLASDAVRVAGQVPAW